VTDFDNLHTVIRAHGFKFPCRVIAGERRALFEFELNGALATMVKDFLKESNWPSVCKVG